MNSDICQLATQIYWELSLSKARQYLCYDDELKVLDHPESRVFAVFTPDMTVKDIRRKLFNIFSQLQDGPRIQGSLSKYAGIIRSTYDQVTE